LQFHFSPSIFLSCWSAQARLRPISSSGSCRCCLKVGFCFPPLVTVNSGQDLHSRSASLTRDHSILPDLKLFSGGVSGACCWFSLGAAGVGPDSQSWCHSRVRARLNLSTSCSSGRVHSSRRSPAAGDLFGKARLSSRWRSASGSGPVDLSFHARFSSPAFGARSRIQSSRRLSSVCRLH
jgi:hypothetical protein